MIFDVPRRDCCQPVSDDGPISSSLTSQCIFYQLQKWIGELITNFHQPRIYLSTWSPHYGTTAENILMRACMLGKRLFCAPVCCKNSKRCPTAGIQSSHILWGFYFFIWLFFAMLNKPLIGITKTLGYSDWPPSRGLRSLYAANSLFPSSIYVKK